MTSRLFSPRLIAFILLLLLGAASLLLNTTSQAMQARASSSSPSSLSAPAVPDDGTETLPPGASIETLLGNMAEPVAMAFNPQGRLFYTEKSTGDVRLFNTATMTLQPSPVIHFDVDGACGERGLLGIAIDPSFNTNHYIYVYYTAYAGLSCSPTTQDPPSSTTNRVARFVENNGVGSNPADIFTSPQTTTSHNGGNIHFGADGKLYISIGDNANAANAQNLTVKNGKMHRINSDGTIPIDNPVFTQTGALPSIYAFGLRNSFDFTFDPVVSGRIWASENGPACDDEMNRIERGYNYGWRASYPCDDPSPSPTYNTIPPLWFLSSGTGSSGTCCQAPTGIAVYTGNQIPQWHNDLFMVTYSDGVLHHFRLNGSRDGLASATDAVQGVTVNTDIETGPDGALWYIQGGGYSTGTLKRIVGPGPTFTPTGTATRTATSTATGSATATPTRTATPQPGGCQPVSWTNLAGVTATGNTIRKPANGTAHWNAGATSSQQILTGDGSVQVTADVTNTPKMFGMSHNETTAGYADIDYALYMYSNGGLYVYQAGLNKGQYGTYSPGDILKVAVEGGVVKYYRNATLLYTSTVAPIYPLFMDAAIFTPGAYLQNAIICIGPAPTSTPTRTATRTATRTPTNTATATPLAAGCQPVSWTNLVGVIASGNTLQKPANITAHWNAGADSSQQIPVGDGSVQVDADVTYTVKMFGLAHNETTPSYTDIDYALYMYNTGALYVYEGGLNRGQFGTYSPGDTLKVAIQGGVVKYYRNATLLYSSSVAPTYPLFMDTSIFTTGAYLQNAIICGTTLSPP